jgi:hypothetical protein
LFEYFGVDLAVERIVGADVAGIGNTSVAMTELLREREQGSAIPERREACKGFSCIWSAR